MEFNIASIPSFKILSETKITANYKASNKQTNQMEKLLAYG
jgi:hypothetical protein